MISNIPAWFCASINIHEGAARSWGKKHCQGGAENKSNNFGAFSRILVPSEMDFETFGPEMITLKIIFNVQNQSTLLKHLYSMVSKFDLFKHKYLQVISIWLRYAFKKKNDIIWEIFPTWGGGLPKSQNFCKFTKYFFVCQIHSEVLKHVLQMGG